MFFGLITQRTLKLTPQKSYSNARNTHAGEQNIDLPFRLTAREAFWCVYFVNSTDNLLLLWDNGTPSFTGDYLPRAIMLFTMKFELKG